MNAHTLHCALRIWLPGYGPASASCCISTHAAFGSCVLMHALKVPPRHRDPFDLQSTLECSLRPLGLGSAWLSKGWYCKCGYGKTAKPCKKTCPTTPDPISKQAQAGNQNEDWFLYFIQTKCGTGILRDHSAKFNKLTSRLSFGLNHFLLGTSWRFLKGEMLQSERSQE